MEAGDASGVGVMDLTTRAFRSEWCDAVDPKFASTLPDLLPPDVSLGETVGDASSTLGVPAGVPVSVGSGDNMMSAIGAGCVSEGRLVVSLGTSGTLRSQRRAPCSIPGAVAPLFATRRGLPPAPVHHELHARGRGGAGGVRRGHVARRARRARVRRPGGIRRRSVSAVSGVAVAQLARAPTGVDRHSTEISRVAGRDVPRAAVEGATYSLLAGARRMRELGLPAPTELAAVGRFEVAVLETNRRRHLRRRVKRPTEPESAALGAAMQAAATLEGACGARVRGRAPAPVRGG